MQEIQGDIASLAEHFSLRREAVLLAWQRAVKRDPALTNGDSLPRAELYDCQFWQCAVAYPNISEQ